MPFKKGDPLINRKGRPRKGETFTDALNLILEEQSVTYKDRKISGKEAAARKLLELAMGGDVAALKYLADRIDGTPRQSIELDASVMKAADFVFVDPPDADTTEA